MPKTPSKSPCPKSSRRKLFTSPLKIKGPEVKGADLSNSTGNVTTEAEKSPSAGDVVQAVSSQMNLNKLIKRLRPQ